ncbi:MAG: PfkB family carbohydrate kinase [Candidatus Hodarchaeales archaeon]|jgi:adenosine kinase
MSSNILVIGKTAYKLNFKILSDFSTFNELKTHQAAEAKREYDGMASNIVYGLTVLGSSPTLTSIVGKDFEWNLKPYFEQLGVDLKLFQDSDRETACNFHLMDETDHSILIEQNNCYNYFAEQSLIVKIPPKLLDRFNVIFVGTGKVEADVKFLNYIYETNKAIPVVYSPDGNIREVSQWRFSQILEKVSIFVCNEIELQLLEEKAKATRSDFLQKYPRLKYIVSMEDRSKIIIYAKNLKIKVTDGPVTDEISNLGWQDAFRAGLLYGVSKKKPIDEAAKLAASLASYYVESQGPYSYSPSVEQVQLRAFEVRIVKKEIKN